MTLSRREILAGAAGAAVASALPVQAAADPLAQAFGDLADEFLARSPETATSLGLDKGRRAALKAELTDQSSSELAKDAGICRAWLARLQPVAAASADARLNKDVVDYALQLGRDAGAFAFGQNNLASAMGENSTPYVVSQETGSFVSIPDFLDSQHSIENKDDADAYLARVSAFAANLDKETDRVRRDASAGVLPPDFILKTAIGQMQAFLKLKPSEQRLVTSLATRAARKGIKGDYGGQAAQLTGEKVYPALQRQMEALQALSPKATHDAGVWKFKDGDAYYRWTLKVGTTTSMSAEEVHRMGLEQNAAIEARMDSILKQQGLSKGSVGQRMTALSKDPRFLYPNTDAGRAKILAYLNQLIAQMRLRMGEVSKLKLKAPVVIKRVPPDIQDGAPLGYMNPGSIDGSRPSIYYINLKDNGDWPRYLLPTLTHHETIPGHAWQGAYVTETGKLPLIRIILNGFNAYVEGWALYTEQLTDEIGMYDHDPFGQLGYLSEQKMRAGRLVVDTGLHAMRWTREQAIDWFAGATGEPRGAMTSEVDRYCATPGQACGYKVGHTEILKLRAKAKARLGKAFDLADFNDQLLEAGPVPMDVLAGRIEAYAQRQKT